MSNDVAGLRGGRQADEKFCFSCGRLMHASATNCPACGAVQPAAALARLDNGNSSVQTGLPVRSPRPNEMFCRGCGQPINSAAPFCPKCGAPQYGAGRASHDLPEKSRVAAGVLALLLGGLGVHKFYLGEVGLGVLYLLFCWTFIPAFVGLIEGIYYLCMSDASFTRRYH